MDRLIIDTLNADEINCLLEKMNHDCNYAFNRVLEHGENSGQWNDWNTNSDEYAACLLAMRVRELMGNQARN